MPSNHYDNLQNPYTLQTVYRNWVPLPPLPASVENQMIELRVKDVYYKSLCQMQVTIPIVLKLSPLLTTPNIILLLPLKMSFIVFLCVYQSSNLGLLILDIVHKMSTPNLYPNTNSAYICLSDYQGISTLITQGYIIQSIQKQKQKKSSSFPSN